MLLMSSSPVYFRRAAAGACRASRRAAPAQLTAAAAAFEAGAHQHLRRAAAAAAAAFLIATPSLWPGPAVAGTPFTDTVSGRFPEITAAAGPVLGGDDVARFAQELWMERLEQGGSAGSAEDDQGFVLRLFDLNQDGRTTAEEALRALAIDSAAYDPAAMFEVFDVDSDGTVSATEWSNTLGDLGPNGNAGARYVFNRISALTNRDGNAEGQQPLGPDSFGAAVQLARDVVLGGRAASGLVSGP